MTLLLALLTVAPANAVPMFGHGAVPAATPARCDYCATQRRPAAERDQDESLASQNAWSNGPRYFPAQQVVIVEVPVAAAPPPPPPEPTAWDLRTKIEPGEVLALSELADQAIPIDELDDAFTPLVWD